MTLAIVKKNLFIHLITNTLMKTVFTAQVLNSYQSHKPAGFYDRTKGHTGVDLAYTFEPLLSPVTGTVVLTRFQNQMGNCLYLKDALGSIHLFAHLKSFNVKQGQQVKRGEVLGITGDTGSMLTVNPKTGKKFAHLHYEVITQYPYHTADKNMQRLLLNPITGFNTDPVQYDKELYKQYGVNWQTGQGGPETVPHNPNGF